MRGKLVLFMFPQKKGTTMKFIGIDLHKQTISICVVDQNRTVLERKRLRCADEDSIRVFFDNLGDFQAVVEATGGVARLEMCATAVPAVRFQTHDLLTKSTAHRAVAPKSSA